MSVDLRHAPDKLLATSVTPGRAVEINHRTGEVTLRYTRQHIPTGTETQDQQTFIGARSALESLARWNAQQPDTWLYWL